MRLPGLAGHVTVERDALGTPTVQAGCRLDAARALGFVHGQERFFQMDLLRRLAAGELAELLGEALVKNDRAIRRTAFAPAPAGSCRVRPRPRGTCSGRTPRASTPASRALAARPWEYLLLRSTPAPWRDEDTLLVLLAMFIELQETDGAQESTQGLVAGPAAAGPGGLPAARGHRVGCPAVGSPPGFRRSPNPESSTCGP